jgi:hypothetical protein
MYSHLHEITKPLVFSAGDFVNSLYYKGAALTLEIIKHIEIISLRTILKASSS